MAPIIIKCYTEDFTKRRNDAFRRLELLMNQTFADKSEKFQLLKLALDLYLSTLDCYIETTNLFAETEEEKHVKTPLADYFQKHEAGRSVVETLLNGFDPSTVAKSEHSYTLDSKIDNSISDDLIVVWSENQRYLFLFGYPNRLLQILRQIGSTFVIDKKQRRYKCITSAMDIEWKEDTSITDFNASFLQVLKQCENCDLLTNGIDKKTLYYSKLRRRRTENMCIYAALTELEKLDDEALLDTATSQVTQIILRKYNDGKVPHDSVEYVGFTAPNGQALGLQLHNTTFCYGCAGMYPHSATAPCPNKTKVCTHCSRTGHVKRFCLQRLLEQEVQQNGPMISSTAFASLTDRNPFSMTASIISPDLLPVQSRSMTLADTGANCLVLKCREFFRTLTSTNRGIQLTSGWKLADGFGMAAFTVLGSPKVFTHPAYFVSDAPFHVASDRILRQLGIECDYRLQGPGYRVVGKEVPLTTLGGLNFLQIFPVVRSTKVNFPIQSHAAHTDSRLGWLWHERLMHLDRRVLVNSDLPAPPSVDTCSCCLRTKALFHSTKYTLPSEKDVPTRPNEVLCMDLLVPSSKTIGLTNALAALLIVDCFSRVCYLTPVNSYTLPHLGHKVQLLFTSHRLSCRVMITDRQSAFASSKFLAVMTSRGIKLKLCPRDRHSDFNPVAERSIRSLKAMARAGLTAAHLNDSYWIFAVMYAGFVKNRVHHSRLDAAPLTVHTGRKVETKVIKRFGCLCYAMPGQATKLNKFQALTQTHLFLGFECNSSSVFTTVVQNCKTQRITYPHLTDLSFDELKTVKDLNELFDVQKVSNARQHSGFDTTDVGPSYSYDGKTGHGTGAPSSHQSDSPRDDLENTTSSSMDHTGLDDDSGPMSAMSGSPLPSEIPSHTQSSSPQLLKPLESSITSSFIPNTTTTDDSTDVGDTDTTLPTDTVIKKPFTTRSGRDTTVVDLQKMNLVHFTIQTQEDFSHKPKKLTDNQRKKLIKKRYNARLQNLPLVYSDLHSLSAEERLPYEEATKVEFDILENRGVISIEDKSTVAPGTTIGSCIVLLVTKRSGKVKARCVYNGRKQVEKLTRYFRSPTLSDAAFTLCLSIAAAKNWSFGTCDATCAFPNAALPAGTTLYARIPAGHPQYHQSNKKVIQIHRNIYGTREGPYLWFKFLRTLLSKDLGFRQSKFDDCVFLGKNILVLVYVDDFLILGSPQDIEQFLENIGKHILITTTPVNEIVDFLGLTISRTSNGDYQLSQVEYVKNLLKKYSKYVQKNRNTPLPFDFQKKLFDECESKVQDFLCRELLGSLMQFRLLRIDLLCCFQVLSTLANNPIPLAVYALIHVLEYLSGTWKVVRLFYRKEGTLSFVSISDAEWATNRFTRKSVSGNVTYLGHSIVSAQSHKQRSVATSPAAAELGEIFHTAKLLQFYLEFCSDLKVVISSVAILTDSLSSVKTLEKPVQQDQKHLGLYIHYLKSLQEDYGLLVLHIKREFNLADLMTKQPSSRDFTKMVQLLQQPFQWRHVVLGAKEQ